MTADDRSSSSLPPLPTHRWMADEGFEAWPFFQRAASVLKPIWPIFIYHVAADLLGRLAPLGLALFLVALIAFDAHVVIEHASLWEWLPHLLETLRSPAFIVGAVASVVLLLFLLASLEALIMGGTWAMFGRGLRGEETGWGLAFFRESLDVFPQVLGLWLLQMAAQWVNALVATAIALLAYQGFLSGGMGAYPPYVLAALVALGLSSFALLAGLIRLVFLVASAPLILDDADVGEALLRGAYFTLHQIVSLYRLVLVALAIFLIPLGLYAAAALFNNITLVLPELVPLTALVRLFAEVILWTSMSLLTVWVYGALFALYYHGDRRWPMPDQKPRQTENPRPDSLDQISSIDELIPDNAPHRSSLSDAVEPPETLGTEPDETPEDVGIPQHPESQDPPQEH